MAIPRTLAVDVYVAGQENPQNGHFAVTATYVATSSTPTMPGLVDPVTGDINLDSIAYSSREDQNYEMAILTIFTLRPYIFDSSGRPVQAIFAKPTNSCGIFLVNPEGKPPNKKNMWAKAINDVQLLLFNKNAHHNKPKAERTYSYALGIFVVRLEQPDYFISLDTTLLQSCPPA